MGLLKCLSHTWILKPLIVTIVAIFALLPIITEVGDVEKTVMKTKSEKINNTTNTNVSIVCNGTDMNVTDNKWEDLMIEANDTTSTIRGTIVCNGTEQEAQMEVTSEVEVKVKEPTIKTRDKEARCAYVIALMAVLWLTEAIPIPVTALLPIFMFPMLSVVSAKTISASYVTDTTMLFLGGLIIAVALEETGLHTRISLSVMMLVGARPIMLMFGLMVTTWFLSMWISNTAATSMMIPIIVAVNNTVRSVRTSTSNVNGQVNEGFEMETKEQNQTNDVDSKKHKYIVNGDVNPEDGIDPAEKVELDRLAKGLALSVAYGANIGGIATLTGTPPNLVLKEFADGVYADNTKDLAEPINESPITFAQWMGFAFPMSLITLLLAWIWLSFVFLRCSCFRKQDPRVRRAVNDIIRDRFHKLGWIKFGELQVLIVFVILVILWLFRKPPNIDGWGLLFADDGTSYVSDSTACILLSVVLFLLPLEKPNIFCWFKGGTPKYNPILKWSVVSQRVPWGVIILLGGGFAIAKASKESGLSEWMGDELVGLSKFDPWVLNFFVTCIVALATEVTSNTATANLLLPILRDMSIAINYNPLFLMMSSAVACSFAFMLPVATPPNAIVFSTGYLSIPDMAIAGAPMNIIAILCLTLSVNTWGKAMFDLDTMQSFLVTDAPTTTTPIMNTTVTP